MQTKYENFMFEIPPGIDVEKLYNTIAKLIAARNVFISQNIIGDYNSQGLSDNDITSEKDKELVTLQLIRLSETLKTWLTNYNVSILSCKTNDRVLTIQFSLTSI